MKYLFIVQGEGRGHMTQAVALKHLLQQAGHHIVGCIIGTSIRREVPTFFEAEMTCPITKVLSPNFVTDHQDKSIHLLKTIVHNGRQLSQYNTSLKTIASAVDRLRPDVVINFYEVLGGLYFLFHRPNLHCVCIAHQYLAGHPEFSMAKGKLLDPLLFSLNNAMTAIGANKKLALSFRELLPHRKGLEVVPPLLRRDVFDLKPVRSDYLLAYVVNSGYSEELIQWHHKNPDIKIHCFWDKKGVESVYHYSDNLIFHKINGPKFLQMMEKCDAYISTAGFESICEAFYLGKPILMVPVKGQYEQQCNAMDASKADIGVSDMHFDIDRLLKFAKNYHQCRPMDTYHPWVHSAAHRFLRSLSCFEVAPRYRRKFKKLAIAPIRALLMAL